MDHTLATIKSAQCREKDRRMKQIMSKANGAAAVSSDDHLAPASLPPISRDSSSSSAALSPIERVFRSHASAKLLLPFEHAYQQLASESKEAAASVGGSATSDEPDRAAAASSAPASSAPGGPAEPSPSSSHAIEQQQPQSAFYSRAMPTLIASFAEYLQSFPAALCLEPVCCNVTVQSAPAPMLMGAGSAAAVASSSLVGSAVQLRVTLWPWEDLTQLARRIVAESTRPEQPAAAAIQLCPVTADRVAVTLTSTGQGGKQGNDGAASSFSSAVASSSPPLHSSSSLHLPLLNTY